MGSPRRTAVAAIAVVLAVGLLVIAVPPGAAQTSDARAERERVRAERAQLALQIDALEADDASLDEALRVHLAL